MFEINLGGEGEEPGVLNQQPPFALGPGWLSQSQETIAQLTARGIPFLICHNNTVALPDESIDVVYTNSVPIDQPGYQGEPGVQTSEIARILKRGGRHIDTDSYGLVTVWTKPV